MGMRVDSLIEKHIGVFAFFFIAETLTFEVGL